ncbi:hypothetical protein POL68_34745 [Stigmatella sp. ncwal1]|uniref:Lipoprotein n=1 Tax=Stigmatella ashevillensis TaxID=2995309 RepID=A0ABT5DJ55_9BACT|nr:hypothetical protein [Stigmatella ashevillena]MDC0713677.1 hypothetical protein [Stigmatella ashevillena]
MRSLHLTAQHAGDGRGALQGLLCFSGWLAVLLLVACVSGGDGRASADNGLERAVGAERLMDSGRPVTKPWKAASEALAAGTHEPLTVQFHRSLQPSWRGRAGFPPDAQAVQRALRARQDALSAALAYRFCHPVASVAMGYHADRPTILTQSLRGPPAFG